jgi:DNA polymerase
VPTKKKAAKKKAPKKEKDPFELPPVLQQAASDMNLTQEQMRRKLLTEPTSVHLSVRDGHVKFLPGACVNGVLPLGNHGVEVVVVTGMPKKDDQRAKRVSMHGTALKALQQMGAPGLESWYVTPGVKFVPEVNVKKPKKAWVNLCRPLMLTELEMLKPKYVLLMGAEAVQAVLGTATTITKIRGGVVNMNGMHIMATMNPSALHYAPEQKGAFLRDLETFVDFVKSGGTREKYVGDYEQITNLQQCCKVVEQILREWNADPNGRHRLAMDCEWGSLERSDYIHGNLRSIQFSHKKGVGYTIVLRRAGMVYDPKTCCSEPEIAQALRELINYPGVEIGGHNFREDMHWLLRIGLNCLQGYLRGFDTMLGYHAAYQEEDAFGLEQLALRYTGLGRYDLPVQQWRDANGFGDKSEALEKHGYAFVPDDLLFDVYAPADVDVVMHAWDPIEQKLQSMNVAVPYVVDGPVNTMYDFYKQIVHPCNIPLFEMEETGIAPDVQRLKGMTELNEQYITRLEQKFRELIKWPEFNVRAVENVRELLFGSNFVGKPQIRPEDAVTLGLTPISTTEKPARKWAEVPDKDKEAFRVFPHTGAESLKIFVSNEMDSKGIDESESLVYRLQQLKFLDQLRKNFLRPPEKDADDVLRWNGGLIGEMGKDGRVHTTISQLTDTGRYRSYRPNMQNLPKKQENELRKIFTPDMKKLMETPKWGGLTEQELKDLGVMDPDYYTLRSCFVADPGHVIIEADYRQAELFTMAHLARDQAMIAMLDDPEMDFHSEMAIRAFNLPCERAEVKKAYPAQRVMAKNVTFGSDAEVKPRKTTGTLRCQPELKGVIHPGATTRA